MSPANRVRELVELKRFGTNPGALRGWLFLPSILAPRAALVVVLHGCTQTSAGYDLGSGWSQLAEEKGFAVLFPEQQRSNNANLCFNWFEPGDIRRDVGEAASIKEMVDHVMQSHGLDSDRIYVTGLSAGGAMANVMLAAYPDLLAGGAIIGGLPYGVSSGVAQAFERMHGRNPPSSKTLRKALATTSTRPRRLPSISIWHGTHDQTVKSVNAEQIADQWRGAHELLALPSEETINGHLHQAWSDPHGRTLVELYLVKGMAHGVPLASPADTALGTAGPYMLSAGISSTARIAMSWGLADANDVSMYEQSTITRNVVAGHDRIESLVARALEFAKSKGGQSRSDHSTEQGVGKVINDALRKAGLLK
jgi:poly(hydroxyalkanoate) depolymerase family esterase